MDTSRFFRATRGASYVEGIVLVGVVALLAVLGFRTFGRALTGKSSDFGERVVALNATSGGNATTCTGGSCIGGSSCFAAGTWIATPEGLQPIERIVAGDLVLSADERTGETVERRVTATFVTPDRDVLDLSLREHAAPLRATPGHLFFTLDRGWLPTESLRRGEPLVDDHGSVLTVDSVHPVATRETVYNFEVDETHTYFVGEARVLVHNPKHTQGHGKLEPVPGQEGIDPELAAMLIAMGEDVPASSTSYYVPPLPPNSAIVELSNDPGNLKDAQQYSAAHGVPVYFSYNLDPKTPAPAGAPVGGVVYMPTKTGVKPSTSDGTTAFIPSALAGKGTLVLGSHGWPGQVQWGGPLRQNYFGHRISGEDLVGRLANAGYAPAGVDPNAHVFALPCNVCTNPPLGPSVAQQVADGFHVPTEGLEKTSDKPGPHAGENAAGPVAYDEPPGMPHVPIVNAVGEPRYLVPTVADTNGRYATCTPN